MVDASNSLGFVGGGEFRIGAVLSRAFSTFGRNFAAFFVVAGVASLPQVASYWTQASALDTMFQGGLKTGTAALAAQGNGGASATNTILSLLASILTIIVEAAIIYDAVGMMSGRAPSFGGSLRAGVSRFWPFFGTGLLLGLGAAFGFALLLVPGVILLMAWFVAVPVCVVERLGPIRSLSRSARLTKGHRWALFGLAVLGFVGYALAAGLMFGLLSLTGVIGFVVGEYIVHVVSIALGAVLAAAAYYELRVAEEGMDTRTIASAFD
jgi:hypothetical protein